MVTKNLRQKDDRIIADVAIEENYTVLGVFMKT